MADLLTVSNKDLENGVFVQASKKDDDTVSIIAVNHKYRKDHFVTLDITLPASVVDGTVSTHFVVDATHSNYWDNPSGTGSLEQVTVPAIVSGVVTITMQPRSVHLLEVVPAVPPGTPVVFTSPILAGAFVGQTLSTDHGVWVGQDPITYTYQWQISSDGLTGWGDISGETGSSYVVTSDALGLYLRCSVVPINGVGTGDAAPSAPLGPVVEGMVLPSQPSYLRLMVLGSGPQPAPDFPTYAYRSN